MNFIYSTQDIYMTARQATRKEKLSYMVKKIKKNVNPYLYLRLDFS